MKEWDDVTILLLLFYPGTVADRSEWLARCSVSFILYLGQLQHTFLPHNNLCSKRNPPCLFFLNLVYLFTKCSPVYFLKPHSVQNVMQPDGPQNPDLC